MRLPARLLARLFAQGRRHALPLYLLLAVGFAAPLLIVAGFYPSAVLYLVYAAFVAWGFAVWFRVQNKNFGQKMAS